MTADSSIELRPATTRGRWLRGAAIAIFAIALTSRALAHVYQYDDIATVTIADPGSDNAGNCGTSGITRSFVVPATDSFTVLRVALGLNVTHDTRGELRIELFNPAASLVAAPPLVVVAGSSAGGRDDDDNYDVLFSSNSDSGEPGTAPVDDGDTDPVAGPFFSRLVTISGMNFFTGNSVGTWTLRVCDIDATGGTSTYNRSRLVLESETAAGSVCTSRMSYDWGAAGNGGDFSSTVVGDVTLSETTTTNYAGGLDSGTNWNFNTDTDSLGGHTGFYSLYMDADNTGGTNDSEGLGQLVAFTFSSAAQDLELSTLDSDQANDDFEDIIRIEGAAVGSGLARYGRSPVGSPVFQIAGDGIEGDSACDNGSTCGSETYKFDRALTTVTVHYDAGDDVPDSPGDQVVGISDFSFCAFDYGDAPNTYGDQLSSGPKHVLGNRLLYLGTNPPDGESDGQPAAAATTDDTTQVGGVDDEDGVSTFGSCPLNGTYSVTVNATNNSGADGFLVGYIDWNRDGDFGDTGERSTTDTVATGTSNSNRTVSWTSVPSNCGGTTQAYARFRFTTTQTRAESPTDGTGVQAPDGEVEDYLIAAGTLPVTVARVESERSGDMLAVRWTTATETSNAGFRLWGLDGTGRRSPLGTVRSRGADSFEPQHYEARVAAAAAEITAVEIEDLSLFGNTRRHGPFAVGRTAGEEPQGAEIDWAKVRAESGVVTPIERMAAAESGRPGDMAKGALAPVKGVVATSGLLLVREEGIHRVTYEQLAAAGVDLAGADPAGIALLNDGAGIPRFVFTDGPLFGPGAFVEFVARPKLTLASPVDAIVLATNTPQQAVTPGRLLARGGALATVRATDIHQRDLIYSFAAPNGDPWYEQDLLAWGGQAALSRTFDLPNLAAGPAWITVRAWGYGDFPGGDPDHHVLVRLNGSEVANERFDGVRSWNRTIDVSGLVSASGNLLEVEVPGDTGFDYDYLAFDGFAVGYARQTVAVGERFKGSTTSTGTLVGGFTPGSTVSIWKMGSTGKARLAAADRGQQVAPLDGTVSVAPSGELYGAAQSALYTPAVVAGVPEAQRTSKAQYVIVTHPALASSLGGLVALEQGRGFTTEVVTTDRIFAAYSDHTSSAEAVKSFLLATLAKGNLRYVLLVGADTSDPYDHLGRGSISFVPTEYLPFAQYIGFSPTDERLVDGNGDGVADVPIGRLPVRTPAEVAAVVAKLQSWEQNLATASRSALLVAGASDAGTELADLNQTYQAALSTWSVALAQVDSVGTAGTRQLVLDALNAGTPLVSFVGHSSPGQWDFTPLLRWSDAASFGNAAQPSLIVQWGCWNSYYVEPTYESLSAHLLRSAGGAAGAIGASSLLSQSSQELLGRLFFAQVNRGAPTVGEALLQAKRDLLKLGTGQDVVLGTILLGDPAMSVPQSKR